MEDPFVNLELQLRTWMELTNNFQFLSAPLNSCLICHIYPVDVLVLTSK